MYSKRIWLNDISSSSTSSVVAYDGEATNIDNYNRYQVRFLEIADCRNKVRLSLGPDDSDKDFIQKLEVLKLQIENFINYLREDT